MPPRKTTTDDSDPFPTAGVDSIKADDPDAQIISATSGPKTSPGSKLFFVLTSESKTVIVHQRPSGSFALYDMRPKVAALSNVTAMAKGGSAA